MTLHRPSYRLALLFAPALLIITLLVSLPALAQDAAIEFVGQLQAQTPTTITVNGVTIDITSAEIDGPLVIGALVKVEAVLINNQYVAREVEAGGDDDLRPDEIELVGFVQAIDATTLLIGGQLIDLTSAEVAAGIDAGSIVKIHATLSDTGAWVAREVALFGNDDLGNDDFGNDDDLGDDDSDDEDDFRIIGTLESVGDGTLTISGQQFDIAQAEVEGLLALGSLVRVEFQQVGGLWVITEVRSTGALAGSDDGNDDNDDDLSDDNFVCGQIPGGWTTYTIQQGDTLSGIASRSGAGLPAIVGVNCIANPNSVPVGTVLAVPRTPADRQLFAGDDDDRDDDSDDRDDDHGGDDNDDDNDRDDDNSGNDDRGDDDDHGGDDNDDDDDRDDDHGGDDNDDDDDRGDDHGGDDD